MSIKAGPKHGPKQGLMREQVAAVFQAGVTAADPGEALRRAWIQDGLPRLPAGRRHLLAVGKAAVPMTAMALSLLSTRPDGTILVVTNYENVPDRAFNHPEGETFEVVGAAHPVPDAAGLQAARRIAAVADSMTADDQLILLLSGGGSALMPLPAGDISLEDKMAVTDLLLKSGAEIGDINAVRRALSRLKGGGLAALAAPGAVYSYILSDVPGDVLADIASGPTVPGSTDQDAARAVIARYGLAGHLSPAVQAVLKNENAPMKSNNAVQNILVGSNALSVRAMAERLQTLGIDYEIVSPWLDGAVEEAARLFLNLMQKQEPGSVKAWICGGETGVEVTGSGKGGRNQEMALRLAAMAAAAELPGDWVFLSGGTDGRDGPTDAAGGVVDPQTMARLTAAGLDIADTLANNDSYHGLVASGGLLMTGATGTNVADLQICLYEKPI